MRGRKYRSKIIRERAGTWLMNKVLAVQTMNTGVQLLRTQVNADVHRGLPMVLAFGKGRKELQSKLAS